MRVTITRQINEDVMLSNGQCAEVTINTLLELHPNLLSVDKIENGMLYKDISVGHREGYQCIGEATREDQFIFDLISVLRKRIEE